MRIMLAGLAIFAGATILGLSYRDHLASAWRVLSGDTAAATSGGSNSQGAF